jgi:hypothetical protein
MTVPLGGGPLARTEPELEQAFPSTIAEPHDREAEAETTTPQLSGHRTPLDAEAPGAAPPAIARRVSKRVLVGVGALALAGVAALLLLTGNRGSDKPVAGPAGAASSAAAATAPPQPASNPVEATASALTVPATASRPAAAPSAARSSVSARAPASGARKPAATKSKPVETAVLAEPERPVHTTPSVHETREEPRPPPAPKSSPVDVCREKIFISRELCLAEQCAKPGTFNHPLCVKRRADAQLRGESIRN